MIRNIFESRRTTALGSGAFFKSSDQCRVGFRLKPDLGIMVVVVVVKS